MKLNMYFKIDEINYARYDYLNYCTIPFKNDMDRRTFAELCQSDDEEGMKWLLANGYENSVFDCTYKHVFFH